MYSIPFSQTSQITAFLHTYEEDSDIRAHVEDISISNSTLEEVFIKVTKEDEEPGARAVEEEEFVNLRERPY